MKELNQHILELHAKEGRHISRQELLNRINQALAPQKLSLSKDWFLRITIDPQAKSFKGFNVGQAYKEAIAAALSIPVTEIIWHTRQPKTE